MNSGVLLFIKGSGFFPFLVEGKKAGRPPFLYMDLILPNDGCRLDPPVSAKETNSESQTAYLDLDADFRPSTQADMRDVISVMNYEQMSGTCQFFFLISFFL